MKNQKLVIHLATLTLVGMTSIGLLVVSFFQDRSIYELLAGHSAIWLQLTLGVGVGLIAGWFAQKIVDQPFMEEVNLRYSRMIGELHLTWPQVIYVSLCAGIGEEILFRGALQPFLGIVLTALIFVAIHGYLNPRDWRISIYGLFMTAVITILGWLTREYGIMVAILAHTIIDLYLLTVMKIREKNEPEEPDEMLWHWGEDDDDEVPDDNSFGDSETDTLEQKL